MLQKMLAPIGVVSCENFQHSGFGRFYFGFWSYSLQLLFNENYSGLSAESWFQYIYRFTIYTNDQCSYICIHM